MSDQGWVVSAKLEGRGGAFCVVMFWIWAVFGLLVNTVNFMAATGSVGVGTSSYLTVGMLYWIAGMIMFGFGAVIHRYTYDFKRPPA